MTPEPSKPAQQIQLVTLVDRQSEVDSPVYYANHAMVRATAEEVFTTFYLRKMHCLESPDENGQASVETKAIATFVLGVPHAIRLAAALLNQCGPAAQDAHAILEELLRSLPSPPTQPT